MRVSFLIIALTGTSVALPTVAQGFGGIARGVLGSSAANLADRATRSPPVKAAKPAGKAAPQGPTAPASPAEQSEGSIVVAEDMPVISSDGVRVAVVKHTTTGGVIYAPDKTFFTADPYYRLRRIYGREATVSGGAVRLKMTAVQYRARNQNPD